MPKVSTGPSIYGNLVFAAWPVVAFCLAVITGSIVWTAAIMVGAFVALLIAHEMVLHRTKLVPVTENEVRESRRSAIFFATALVVAVVVLLAVRQYNAI